MTVDTKIINRPISDIPKIVAESAQMGFRKVSNWTHSAKNWISENKEALLTALKVLAVVTTLVGIGFIGAGLSTEAFFTASSFGAGFNSWWFSQSFSELALSLGPKLAIGLSLVAGGQFLSHVASKAKLSSIHID